MFDFIRLELRKQRMLLWGFPLAFAVTSLFAAGAALYAGHSVRFALGACALSWWLGTLPFLPALCGATVGGGLRREPHASIEAPLPISPGRKLLAGLLAAAFCWFAISAVLTAACMLLSPALGDESLLLGVHTDNPGELSAVLGVACLAGVPMLILSFALAYQTANTLLGAWLALIATAVTGGGIALGLLSGFLILGGERFRDAAGTLPWMALLLPPLAIVLAGCLTALWATRRLAHWGERRARPGLTGWVTIAASLACGSVLATGWGLRTYLHYCRQLLPAGMTASGRLSPDAPQPDSGTLLHTRDGGLLRVTPEGRRVALLAPETLHPLALLKFPWGRRIRDVAVDRDGSVWALINDDYAKRAERSDELAYELWHGPADGRMVMISHFKSPELAQDQEAGFAWREGRLVLAASRWERDAAYSIEARLPAPGGAPGPWRRSRVVSSYYYAGGTGVPSAWLDGRVATVSPDSGTVVRLDAGGVEHTCRMPASVKASMNLVVNLAANGDGNTFLMSARLKDGKAGRALLRCPPDGEAAVLKVYPDARGLWIARQDSPAPQSLWRARLVEGMVVVTGVQEAVVTGEWTVDGGKLAQWYGRPAARGDWAEVLHRADGRAWILTGNSRLVEIDTANGALLDAAQLKGTDPALDREKDRRFIGPEMIGVEGFHYIEDGRLYFARWDGECADQGPAVI